MLIAGLSISTAQAQTAGVSGDKVTFGQSAAFDGPAGALGTGMNQGLMAAFSAANKAGGINGRMLEIVTYDDGYEPERAVENTKKLIDVDKVFSLIGAVGTPTSKATQPIATAAGVPFIGPFTGAGFLRAPENVNVINVRATYDQETEAWIKHLTEDLGISKIAILYQDDGFGRVGLSGVNKALEKAGKDLTRENFLDAIYNTGNFDLGGVALEYGAGDNQGSNNVFMTVIQADGSFMAVEKLSG